MDTFWDNISKFPRFLLSVLAGFFLTTFYPIFELLAKKKKKTLAILTSLGFIWILYYILRLILDIN